jgi:cytochrome c553
VKQLRNFRSGERRHDFMAMMARSIDDVDTADIAAYFASLPLMRGDGSGDTLTGRALYSRGDPTRGITACVECHGGVGKGRAIDGGVSLPAIGGQDARYLAKQLTEWRSGERRNSPDGAMNRVTKALTDDEIRALANYLAGL